jgi:hypothetical protein
VSFLRESFFLGETYWTASWREGGKVRNIHLGSTRKLSREATMQKARKMKAEALGL